MKGVAIEVVAAYAVLILCGFTFIGSCHIKHRKKEAEKEYRKGYSAVISLLERKEYKKVEALYQIAAYGKQTPYHKGVKDAYLTSFFRKDNK